MLARFKQLKVFSLLCVYLFLSLIGAEIIFSQNKRDSPLTLTQVLNGLRTQGKTNETKTLETRNNYIVKRIRQRGIDFELSEDGEKSLREAGASEDLIEAIRNINIFRQAKIDAGERQKAEGYFNRGQLCAEDDSECRFANFTKAIELDSDFALAYLYRGLANARLNNFEEAIEDYNKVIEIKPKEAFAYNNRGVAFAKKGNFEQAIADYTKALELNPRDGNTYNNRGNAYSQINKFDLAIEDYHKAIELNPNFASVYKNRGNAYLNLKNYDRAISDYARAIELEPENPNFFRVRAEAYFSKGDYRQAIVDYTRAIELNPDEAIAYEYRGFCYEQIGEKEKAKIDGYLAEKLRSKR